MTSIWQRQAAGKAHLKTPEPNRVPSIEDAINLTEWDSGALTQYRSQLRPGVVQKLPKSLDEIDFLDQAGYRVNGNLTRTAALLFTGRPDRHIPGAVTRCVVYLGLDKSANRKRDELTGPVFEQIDGAFDFIKLNTNRVESIGSASPRSAPA